MVFCVLETVSKKELFVCPVCWFEGDENNGIVHYPPDASWCSEPARLLAKYAEYQLAVQGMHRLEEGATSEEGRWDEKEFRKLNALRNKSNISSVQDIIDSCNKIKEVPPNLSVTFHPSASTSTSQLHDVSFNKAIENNNLHDITPLYTIDGTQIIEDEFNVQLSGTDDRTQNQNNIVLEMPEITGRLDKMENDIGTVILAVSKIDKKINKLIEAVANMGTLMSKENHQGISQPIEPIGNNSCFSSLLPINDQHVFGEFETMLRNKDNYQKFVTGIELRTGLWTNYLLASS